MVLQFNNISSAPLTALDLTLLYILIIPQVQTEGHLSRANSHRVLLYFAKARFFLALLRLSGKHRAPPSGGNEKWKNKLSPKLVIQTLSEKQSTGRSSCLHANRETETAFSLILLSVVITTAPLSSSDQQKRRTQHFLNKMTRYKWENKKVLIIPMHFV